MNRSRDQFFTRPRFAGEVRTVESVGAARVLVRGPRAELEKFPRPHLKHPSPDDFLAQRNILVLQSLFSLFAGYWYVVTATLPA